MYGHAAYGQTENLPILQDLISYRDRCPKRRNRETETVAQALYGQRFPCLTLILFSNVIFLINVGESRAVALIGDKVL